MCDACEPCGHPTRAIQDTLPPACSPPLGPLQAEPGEKLRWTYVGLGTGGLDMQDIRKSFFLLDFPKMERRSGIWSAQSINIPWASLGQTHLGTETAQASGPQGAPGADTDAEGQCGQGPDEAWNLRAPTGCSWLKPHWPSRQWPSGPTGPRAITPPNHPRKDGASRVRLPGRWLHCRSVPRATHQAATEHPPQGVGPGLRR